MFTVALLFTRNNFALNSAINVHERQFFPEMLIGRNVEERTKRHGFDIDKYS